MAPAMLPNNEPNSPGPDEARILNFTPNLSCKVQIVQLLLKIHSVVLNQCIDGCKEFEKHLKGRSGGELLFEYVGSSSDLSELLVVWNRCRGKAEMSSLLSLISVILNHSDGRYDKSIHDRVDKFGRLIVEEKMDDLYVEINSNDGKRQKAALLLLASVVRRGSSLANEVAKRFDFKNPVFGRLSEYKRKVVVGVKKKCSTRGAFVEFALSFLEAGKPGLVKLVLQQRELFSGILRGLGNDDGSTVVHILSTLRDKVLSKDSGVPPPLRSVLFGSVTLEQVAEISARGKFQEDARVGYKVLRMVCIDPSNGLMPDPKRKPAPLKGNHKRLVDLMKKLNAINAFRHRKLLLAICYGRPALASSYLDQFPYNLEDHSSATWVHAVTLAVKVISSVRDGIEWDILAQKADKLTFEDAVVQNVYKCVCIRQFSRLTVNKGLLHSDPLVKHGTLSLLLEILKLFNSLIGAISCNGSSSLKQKLKDEVRIFLPDSQVLFTLISSVGTFYQNSRSSRKRVHSENICADKTNVKKRRKTESNHEDVDIHVSGLDSDAELMLFDDSEKNWDMNEVTLPSSGNDIDNGLFKIWDSDESFLTLDVANKDDVFFHCKVLECLKLYHRILIDVVEVSYDVLKILPSDPLELPSILLQSFLSMLIEHFGCSTVLDISFTMLPPIYKHLQSLLILFLNSPVKALRQQAYILAKAAMMSTGAFDHNSWEVGSWFLFLPGNIQPDDCCGYVESKSLQSLSTPVVSFLCDAVCTVGNNLVKYWDILKCQYSTVETSKEKNIVASPLIICILEKCLRILGADSGAFTLPEKSLISVYVCNTIKYLLQTQVEARNLAAVIRQFLSEKIGNQNPTVADSESNVCEWRPLIALMLFSQSIQCQETCNTLSTRRIPRKGNQSFADILTELNSIWTTGSNEGSEMLKAVYFTIICSAPDNLLQCLPSVLALFRETPGFHHYLMNYFSVDHSVLKLISNLWPDMFRSGLEMSLVASVEVSESSAKQIANWSFCTNPETTIFGSYLKEAPFHALFPALIFCGLESSSKIKQLLVAKISKLTSEHFIPSLRLVLFWFHQIQLSYRKRRSQQHEWQSEVCHMLLKQILEIMSSLKSEWAPSEAAVLSVSGQEVAKTVFVHPAVTSALLYPFESNYDLTEEIIEDFSEGLPGRCVDKICKIECLAVEVLHTTCEYLLTLCTRENSSPLYSECKEKIAKDFNYLVQWLFSVFKDRFNQWYKAGNMTLLPILCAIVALMRFISPLDLLELANWVFTRMEHSENMHFQTSNISPECLSLSMASAAFDMLSQSVQSPDKLVASNLFWAMGMKGLDASLFRTIYLKAFYSATVSKIDIADKCLVKALSVAQNLVDRQELLPFSMKITRVITSTPTDIVSHCLSGISSTKATLLYLFVESSPLHSSFFGDSLSEILRKDCDQDLNVDQRSISRGFSADALLMLLPAVVSYINSSGAKLKAKSCGITEIIPAFYARVLLDGFSNWKEFVSKAVFKMENDDFSHCLDEDPHDLSRCSLLGKAINVLWPYFALTEDTGNKRLQVFNSICPSSGALESFLDFDVGNSYAVEELLNLTNGAVVKISFCLRLLFPEDCDKVSSSEIHVEKGESVLGLSDEKSSKARFLELLVCVWQQIVKKFPSTSNDWDQKSPIFLLLRSLEVFTLKTIYKLILKMQHDLILMHPVPYVEDITKAALLHRFRDPTTLGVLRCILFSLSDGNLSVIPILQLLLGHSQLSSSISSVGGISDFVQSGIAVKPISSLLKSFTITTEKYPREHERYRCQLQVIKLMRLLFQLRACRDDSLSEDDLGVNMRELVLLLLSSYRATSGEIDVEIHGVLSEIESAEMGHKTIAELDYLWGSSPSLRKENRVGNDIVNNDIGDVELEQRRIQFRDNLPIDTKLFIETIVHFPYNGPTSEKALSDSSHCNHVPYNVEGIMNAGRLKLYDPIFVLSLSIHSLSMGYLDPVEFAGLGLLAVAVVSTASADGRIRKLGYEVLGRFTETLKNSPKRREVTRLKLLLTYLQNGVEEPWQRFPTISALFVAEASVVLLDPSNEHYLAISKFLCQNSRIDVKKIPFFRDVFGTGSVKYRTDRLWMLRLLYAGIHSEDDALIFIRNSVPETLLSDFSSSTSDTELKELILQVVKKCVKEQTMARYLVENCCLISWLSSVLALTMNVTNDHDFFATKKFITVLEVAQQIISSESAMEWVEKHALEQLSDLSYHLLNLLVTRSKLLQKAVPSVIIILEVIVSTLEASQKRDVALPRFNPSIRSLYQLYEAVNAVESENAGQCAELGLKAILMSIPPTNLDLDKEELSKFLAWASSTALLLDSQNAKRQTNPSCFTVRVEKLTPEDSIASTLLRWLVASVLQRVSYNLGDSGPKGETLLSLMEHLKRGDGASILSSGYSGILAADIYHLLPRHGMKCKVLPSAVAALSILLSDRFDISVDESGNPSDVNSLMSKIGYPSEANPAWKWSFQQPWSDQIERNSDSIRVDMLHSCQNLLAKLLPIMEELNH